MKMVFKNSTISMLAVAILIIASFGVAVSSSPINNQLTSKNYSLKVNSRFKVDLPSAIEVSNSNPFYALIATPIAINYNETGVKNIIPLYVKNFNNPSKSVERAEEQIGIYADFTIGNNFTPKEISLYAAEMFWEGADTALIIKEDQVGYELGIVATPLASYLSIPIIVTDEIDVEVESILDDLGVTSVFICGNLETTHYCTTIFDNIDEIITYKLNIIKNVLDQDVNYITLANPLDITYPEILDSTEFDFEGTLAPGVALPTQTVDLLKNPAMAIHEFEIPSDYKYCQLKLMVENIEYQNAESLGDKISAMILDPEANTYIYASSNGNVQERDVEGDIIEDVLDFEVTIYDNPGTYQLQIFGNWFASREASYNAKVTLEKMDSTVVPLMYNLSSIAPYLTAYHTGVLFAKSDFAFAADDDVLFNGSTCPGVSQAGTNPKLIEPANEHTFGIHEELNEILADIAEIDISNFEELRDHYAENPAYVAITADPTMVPMYFYKNPDGTPDMDAYLLGFALPSDFVYGDIDIDPADPENNTYSYWPFQENIVGRVTGTDVQDCSALIARTIFYENLVDDLDDWKDNGLVQTGCGLEFQNLPIITRLSQLLYSGRGEPTKFPTGESSFINLRMKEQMEKGFAEVKNTMFLKSQREGFTQEELQMIKDLGFLNKLLFPKNFIYNIDSAEEVNGGEDQIDSNLIFTFAHGLFNIYEHGDVLMDSRGFPFVTIFSRIYPYIRSGLSAKGTYDIRSVENMAYNPSVIFVVSCVTGRTDGIKATETLSQTYLHAGVNAYVGATRVTADPGYLEPRPLPGGLGFGILGLTKAFLDLKLKGEYPDSHFGALIGEDFILDMIENNSDTGTALRNAKNKYLPKDANSTFLWSPPLPISTGHGWLDKKYNDMLYENAATNEATNVLGKKYVALHEFTLYGDPAFNPYQSINEGR